MVFQYFQVPRSLRIVVVLYFVHPTPCDVREAAGSLPLGFGLPPIGRDDSDDDSDDCDSPDPEPPPPAPPPDPHDLSPRPCDATLTAILTDTPRHIPPPSPIPRPPDPPGYGFDFGHSAATTQDRRPIAQASNTLTSTSSIFSNIRSKYATTPDISCVIRDIMVKAEGSAPVQHRYSNAHATHGPRCIGSFTTAQDTDLSIPPYPPDPPGFGFSFQLVGHPVPSLTSAAA